MKNIYQNIAKKLLKARKNLKSVASGWINTLKNDFSFYNSHTELLAIWTVLFFTIAGLLFLASKSNILIMFLLFIFAVVVMFIGAFVAVYYLHALKYHHKKRLLSKIHNLLNKSFKLRSLLIYIKIPYKFKNLKHLIKLNFKFAS